MCSPDVTGTGGAMAREREAIVRALRLGGTAPGSLAPIPDLCDANLRGCARPRSEVDVRGERSMRSQPAVGIVSQLFLVYYVFSLLTQPV